jgi:hypothetical protein
MNPLMVQEIGLEPMTPILSEWYSTTELYLRKYSHPDSNWNP